MTTLDFSACTLNILARAQWMLRPLVVAAILNVPFGFAGANGIPASVARDSSPLDTASDQVQTCNTTVPTSTIRTTTSNSSSVPEHGSSISGPLYGGVTGLRAHAEDPEKRRVESQSVSGKFTSRDLLVSIKRALEQDLFTSRSFYQEENLLRFFAAKEVQWARRDSAKVLVILKGVTYFPTHHGVPPLVGLIAVFQHDGDSTAKDGGTWAALSLGCSCQLRVEDADKIFGMKGRTDVYIPRDTTNHYAVRPRATDPMGYRRVTYDVPAPRGYESSFAVELDGDGQIRSMTARQRERL